jgi:2-dehydropantoate 2-reductase
MRQVPALDAAPFGIVGDGRVARHFLHYFNLLGLSVRAWSRRVPAAGPIEALAPCRTVLLLIRDAEIVSFIDLWPGLREKRLVHFSGSLATHAAEGAHPLMTFSHDLYDLATYRSIPFVLDSDGTPFDELLPGLPNPSFTIPASDRPYYHALCVMAGNFSTILWLKLFDELQGRFGIPASAARPYLAQMTTNLLADASQALTGPLARRDVETIGANLAALEGDPFHAVYAAFVRAYDRRT